MIFKLLQVNVPREEMEIVNQVGWTEAFTLNPRIEAQQVTRMSGAEAWSPTFTQYYEHVSDIEANDLDHAFLLHNNPAGNPEFEAKITRHAKQHSMSVGDILVDEYGCYHMCDPAGWTQLLSTIPAQEAA